MVLDNILAHKHREVEEKKLRTPVSALVRDLQPSDRSLERALLKERPAFIMEFKRASPSRGDIRRYCDPVSIARTYARHADAISVLTDAAFFHGSFDDLRAVRSAVALPVLCKDFVIDPYQVAEARFFGADAVLLMLCVLDDAAFASCFETARSLSLDVLAEVRSPEDLSRALGLGARIIGINNRDLRTLEVDLEMTEFLSPLVPRDRIVVCESGMKFHRDVARLSPLADAFLVGTSLMEKSDVDAACREIVFGRVKVCGLTRREDTLCAAAQGATYGGLVFANDSPRRVSLEQAKRVSADVPLGWVGVFVDERPDMIASVARDLSLHAVQLHGDETPGVIGEIRRALPENCEIWKALRIKDRIPPISDMPADKSVLDAFSKNARGGTGEPFDWTLLRDTDLSRVILAGGLCPENASEADAIGAFALDISSGVEDKPGIKSEDKLHRFFSALRGKSRSCPCR